MASTRPVTIVGVDCAVKHNKVGVAAGSFGGDGLKITEVFNPESPSALLSFLADHLRHERAALLSLDAPLGWPTQLALGLTEHRAGERHTEPAHRMFRRTTDNVVYENLNKRSLDVGADRIARTAHAALQVLADIRRESGLKIPLAWSPGRTDSVVALEVYPAATVVSRGWSADGYKKAGGDGSMARRKLVRSMRKELDMDDKLAAKVASSDHLIDAVLCVLAAADFARGDVIQPNEEQLKMAQREGWIWVRPRPRP